MKRLSGNLQHKKGQALVEFTLMFPIFLGVLIGLVAFSLMFYSFVTMQLAVREGTSAIVHYPKQNTSASIETIVRSKSFSLNPSALTILVEPADPANWLSGVSVSVTAVYYVPIPNVNIPLIGGGAIRFGPVPVKAVSVMTIE